MIDLTPTLTASIDQILRESKIKFHPGHDIPRKHQRSGLPSRVILSPSESIIFFQDSTLFGGGKEGVLLTTQRLIWKNIAHERMEMKISEINISTLSRKATNQVTLNNRMIEIREDSNAFIKTFTELMNLLPIQRSNETVTPLIQSLKSVTNKARVEDTAISRDRISLTCTGCKATLPVVMDRQMKLITCEWCRKTNYNPNYYNIIEAK